MSTTLAGIRAECDHVGQLVQLAFVRKQVRDLEERIDWRRPLSPDRDRSRAKLAGTFERLHAELDAAWLRHLTDGEERAAFKRARGMEPGSSVKGDSSSRPDARVKVNPNSKPKSDDDDDDIQASRTASTEGDDPSVLESMLAKLVAMLADLRLAADNGTLTEEQLDEAGMFALQVDAMARDSGERTLTKSELGVYMLQRARGPRGPTPAAGLFRPGKSILKFRNPYYGGS